MKITALFKNFLFSFFFTISIFVMALIFLSNEEDPRFLIANFPLSGIFLATYLNISVPIIFRFLIHFFGSAIVNKGFSPYSIELAVFFWLQIECVLLLIRNYLGQETTHPKHPKFLKTASIVSAFVVSFGTIGTYYLLPSSLNPNGELFYVLFSSICFQLFGLFAYYPMIAEMIYRFNKKQLFSFLKLPWPALMIQLPLAYLFISGTIDSKLFIFILLAFELSLIFIRRSQLLLLVQFYVVVLSFSKPTLWGIFQGSSFLEYMAASGVSLLSLTVLGLVIYRSRSYGISKQQKLLFYSVLVFISSITFHLLSIEEERFYDHFKKIEESIVDRLTEQASDIMRVANSVAHFTFSTPKEIYLDPNRFDKFIKGNFLNASYPSVKKVGLIFKVNSSELSNFKIFGQKYFESNFAIRNFPNVNQQFGNFSLIVGQFSPIDFRKEILGTDLAKDEVRRSAAEQAIKTDGLTFTEQTQIIGGKPHPGWVTFYPIQFSKNGKNNNLEFLPAFVAIGVDSVSFFKGAVSPFLSEVDVQFLEPKSGALNLNLNSNSKFTFHGISRQRNIKVANQEFKMVLKSNSGFNSRALSVFWITILVWNTIAVLAIEVLIMAMTSKRKSEKLAEELSVKLVKSAQQASLGEMAGGIAHEINNPLTIIKGTCEKISLLYPKGKVSPEMMFADFQKISATTDRIARIIKGLKSLGRNSENDPFVIYNLNTIVTDALEICQDRFKRNNVDLHVTKPGNDITLNCNPAQIGQVIINLLNNAFDIAVELPERWIKLEVTPLIVDGISFVQISVTDSGKGISSDLLSKIFQPFYTTKEVGKGTGLGLSISDRIIQDHGGKLWYDLNNGNTRFNFRLKQA